MFDRIKQTLKNSAIYHIIAITVITLAMVYFFCRDGGVFGSTVDWISQHAIIPEYFRQRFYETGDLISQFAMNFGGGQNAFNFIYHGYLTPITLISYALPLVSMKTYVIGSSIGIILSSLYLFYFWIRKKGITPFTTFCVTLLFLFSSSFFYHSHKQIMFIEYMPFLIMALIGIDRMYQKRKRELLIISVFLIFMTNYFFSVSAILILTVYAIYEFMTLNPDFNFRTLLKAALVYASSIITSALLSCVALIPAFLAILNGRTSNVTKMPPSFLNMIFPKFTITNMLYNPYGMGLTCIVLIAICSFIVSRKKNRMFLSIAIMVIISFPFITYALNMLLYNNSKIYIPFIPVVLMITAEFLDERRKSIKIKGPEILLPLLWLLSTAFISTGGRYIVVAFAADIAFTIAMLLLSRKSKYPSIFLAPIIVLSCIITLGVSFTDKFISKDLAEDIFDKSKKVLAGRVLEDEDLFYRSNDLTYSHWTGNYIYSMKFYQTSLYSSIYNCEYNKFTHHTINIANSTVNDISTVNTNDWLFDKYMGVKYILADDITPLPYGYKKADSLGKYTMYKNDDVFSIITGSSSLMSKREFMTLSPADRKIALLGYIIVDNDSIPNVYASPLTKFDIDFVLKENPDMIPAADNKFELDDDLDYIEAADKLHIDEKKTKFYTADISSLPYDGYIIEMTLAGYANRQSKITINGIVNAISSLKNAFPKSNLTCSFVITSNTDFDKLDVILEGGGYDVENVVCYGFTTSSVNEFCKNITMSEDTTIYNDNYVLGDLDMKEDGYLTISIPYDKGFTLFIDGEEVQHEKTNTAFIGAPISSGTHRICLVYNTPGLNTGIAFSLIGLVIFIGILIYDIQLSKLGVLSVRRW